MIVNSQTFLQQFETTETFNPEIHAQVTAICDRVQREGDRALLDYNEQFDGVTVETLEVPQADIEAAYYHIDEDLRHALEHSFQRIRDYQTQIKYENQYATPELYEVYHPIERVGIYVPGGKASYPSTVLMTATLAKVAGVKNISVVTPPQPNGIASSVLAACHIVGVDHVYQVGGAQSIAALAYGTETIPKVDKIVGPGNQYVAYAKKALYGEVGIDQIAGPSEIALIIDDTCDLDAIVYDVFAQAEHDEMARTFVISTDLALLESLETRIQEFLKDAPRYDILKVSLTEHHYLIHATDFEDSCRVMNTIAPEHASIQTAQPEDYLPHIYYVGSLFLGGYAPEAIGDYIAGPSHVLPTQRTARFQHGLSVNDFLTKHTVIHLSQSTYEKTYRDAARIAQDEQLYHHQKSLEIRQRGDDV
ncbi:histidinol dehydrogenase [Staphylococcus intermedius]|uniref:Histidinol dehydrogenase n=2 Tax=Staphylococcus TaxID=1279 RepID=A0A380G3I6_STAIN|nr:histidinol dehydrogenase [Staphylococcus intermedius]PCF63970.1 histidinol dehydrogenase [Staphylococcus intermedius]PCF78685.1 histidinol dehydrogenase [Staphylococcus intermedius]PCF79658.1 histidinol dehydrogenase [Staphylococcus intermedius]PCF86607.1 histidinol dehydrogenase [Staphylococcus intermedius]PCF89683.1 histidinol dehydrogenase [Staphylococcus intermedius]